jgi:hypothetical protein
MSFWASLVNSRSGLKTHVRFFCARLRGSKFPFWPKTPQGDLPGCSPPGSVAPGHNPRSCAETAGAGGRTPTAMRAPCGFTARCSMFTGSFSLNLRRNESFAPLLLRLQSGGTVGRIRAPLVQRSVG